MRQGVSLNQLLNLKLEAKVHRIISLTKSSVSIIRIRDLEELQNIKFMFDEWIKRRSLQREIRFLEKDKFKLDELADKEEVLELDGKINSRLQRLDTIDTDRLVKKANQLGIETPYHKENWWWDDIDYVGAEDSRRYLTDMGKMGLSKLITEERRKNIEWWVKIVVTVLTALTGLVGSIIGVVSVLRK